MRDSRVVTALVLPLTLVASILPLRAAEPDPTGLRVLPAVVVDSLALPSAGLRGLSISEERIWMLMTSNRGLSAPDSSFRSAILELDRQTGLLDTLAVENDSYETGLAFDGENLWAGGSLLGERAALFEISPVDGQIFTTLPVAGYHPGGLAWDGSYLWQIDSDARLLFRLEVEEGKISRKVATPGFYPTGLAYDGFHFWCADASTGRLYRLKGFNGRADGVIDAELYDRPGQHVSLAWDGRLLWAVAAGDSFATRLELLR